MFGQPVDTVMAPNGNIYYPAKNTSYEDDLGGSNVDLGKKALFIHEMTHVWQHQQGVRIRGRYLLNPSDRVYEYQFEPNKPFGDYGIEQQADIVRDYFRVKRGVKRGDPKSYEDLLPF